jgi:Ran GTPase-activating protein (RanGAP) involved in mRNA processing and transport
MAVNREIIRLAIGAKTIGLYNQSVDDSELALLVQAMTTPSINTTLKVLSLAQNDITDEGLAMLADMLRNNTTLLFLDLSKNKLTDAGMITLSDALQQNTTLTHLNLDGNPSLSFTAKQEILSLIHQNKNDPGSATQRARSAELRM